MKKLLTSKKGQQENYLALILFIFGFGFITLLSVVLYTKIRDAFITSGYYTGAVASVGNSFMSAFLLYDTIIVLILIVLLIGVGVTSYKLNTAPVFFVVTLVMGAFTGAISYFFNYIFIQLVSDSTFNTVVTLFPKTIIICTNLHWVALAAIIIGSITLYSKKERGSFVGQ